MFTGIIETLGTVTEALSESSNIIFTIKSSITSELKIDQSVAHNGVCLTVTSLDADTYKVTAIKETLDKTNLNTLKIGSKVNLERCMKMDGRLDGHIVQGHVDTTAQCVSVKNEHGSWRYYFQHDTKNDSLLVEKGSICINGVSLTVAGCSEGKFEVAIIPFTFEHTTFQFIKENDLVNIEYDILGKYVARLMGDRLKNS